MIKQAINNRTLLYRLWKYQWERIPLPLIAAVAAVNVGVVFTFSEKPALHLWSATLIIVLYMIQIRTSDEEKDFEHDNQFHTARPVQRGLVTLEELAKVNLTVIGLQLLLYAAFLDVKILMVGLVSQAYAFLTRKEFYIRERLRQRFHLYNFLHYLQLLILQYAVISILEPKGISTFVLIAYAVIHASLMELGRKMYSKEEDTTDDSYSAQLGFRGASITLSIAAAASLAYSAWLIERYNFRTVFLIAPAAAALLVFIATYVYQKSPTKSNSLAAQASAALMYVVSMLAVILSAL